MERGTIGRKLETRPTRRGETRMLVYAGWVIAESVEREVDPVAVSLLKESSHGAAPHQT